MAILSSYNWVLAQPNIEFPEERFKKIDPQKPIGGNLYLLQHEDGTKSCKADVFASKKDSPDYVISMQFVKAAHVKQGVSNELAVSPDHLNADEIFNYLVQGGEKIITLAIDHNTNSTILKIELVAFPRMGID